MTTNQEIFGNVVTIALDGKELNLTPTLGCCMALTRNPGLEALRQRVVSYDLEAVVAVIAAGIGQNARELPALVLRAGMVNIMPSINEFLVGIATGGVSPNTEAAPGESQAGG